jgi:hypothetical protein
VEVSSSTANASGMVQVVNLAAPPEVTPLRQVGPFSAASAGHEAAEKAPHTAVSVRTEASAAGPTAKEDGAKEYVATDKAMPSIPSRSFERTETAAAAGHDAVPTRDVDKEPLAARPGPLTAPVPAAEPSVRVWPEAVPGTLRGKLVGKVPLLRRLRKPAPTSMPTPIFRAQPVLTNPARDSITRPVAVDVRVDVAESGLVEKAEVIQFSDPLNVALTNSALAAAARWTFEPAGSEDAAVSNKVILHFRFTP